MRNAGVAAGAAALLLWSGAALPRASKAAMPAAVLEERRVREADLEFFEARVARDPTGSLDLLRLGGLRLARFWATGDPSELELAESAARRSLANRPHRNPGGWQLLVAALSGQHRFAEAESAAVRLGAELPEDAGARAILGEVQLLRGRLEAADSAFRPLTAQRFAPAVAPRYARWLELRGREGEAKRLLETALAEARGAFGTTSEHLAWYELRLGELALRAGALREARRRLDAGLALLPDDWRLLAARGRVALASGDPARAVQLGDSSLARHVDPATLGLLADAWLARGDSVQGQSFAKARASMQGATAR